MIAVSGVRWGKRGMEADCGFGRSSCMDGEAAFHPGGCERSSLVGLVK